MNTPILDYQYVFILFGPNTVVVMLIHIQHALIQFTPPTDTYLAQVHKKVRYISANKLARQIYPYLWEIWLVISRIVLKS